MTYFLWSKGSVLYFFTLQHHMWCCKVHTAPWCIRVSVGGFYFSFFFRHKCVWWYYLHIVNQIFIVNFLLYHPQNWTFYSIPLRKFPLNECWMLGAGMIEVYYLYDPQNWRLYNFLPLPTPLPHFQANLRARVGWERDCPGYKDLVVLVTQTW